MFSYAEVNDTFEQINVYTDTDILRSICMDVLIK